MDLLKMQKVIGCQQNNMSLAVQNNNPGNIKDPSTGQFKQFGSPQEGYAALLNDLQSKQNGTTTTGLGPDSSLVDFASKYAPASDKNNVGQYAANLANQMGVRPDAKLRDLSVPKWAAAVAHNEDVSSPFGNQDMESLPDNKTSTGQSTYTQDNEPSLSNKLIGRTNDAASALGTLGQGIGEGFTGKGAFDVASGALQGVGAVAGGVGDLANAAIGGINKAVTNIPVVGGAVKGAEDVASGAIKGLVNTAPVQSAISGYQDFAQKNPELAKDIGAAGNIATAFPIVRGAIAAKGAVSGAIEKGLFGAVNPEKEAINAFAPKLSGKAWDAARNSGYIEQKINPLTNAVQPDDFSHNADLQNMLQTVKKYNLAPYKIDANTPKAKLFNSIRDGISKISENYVKPLLAKNPFNYNIGDHYKILNYVSAPRAIAKNPISYEAYNNAKESFQDILTEEFKKTQLGKPINGILDPNDLWKTLSGVDKQLNEIVDVYEHGTPGYNGANAFIKNMRDASRRYLSDNIKYPNQPDKLDILNQFRENPTGNISIDAGKEKGLAQQIGLISTPETEKAASAFDQYMQDLHTLYDAKSNIAPWTRKEGGTGGIIDTLNKKHPIVSGLIKGGAKAAATGLGIKEAGGLLP